MALSFGELVGYASIDDKGVDDGLGRVEGKLKGLGVKGAALGAAAGLAIAGAIGASLLMAMDVEAANDKLAAQLGLNEAESERLGGVAGAAFANAYGDSLSQVNDAAGAVWSTFGDLSDEALQDATEKALGFAETFDTDVAGAVSSAGILMKSGLAKDANEAFDLIVVGSQKVPAALREDLLDAVDEYSGFFADMGFSGEEAMAALVAASDKGMYGIDKTGDAIKELGIRASDMSTASVAAYEAAGLAPEEMAARFVAGGDTAKGALDDLVTALLDMDDPVARSNAAIALFGTPLEDLSVTEIPDFLTGLQGMSDGLGDVEGAAGRMTDTLGGNAASKMESWKRTAQQAFVNLLGGKILPIIEDAATWLEDVLGPAVESVVGWFGEAGAKGGWLADTWAAVFDAVKGFITDNTALFVGWWNSLRGIFDQLVELWAAVWTRVQEFWDDHGQHIIDVLLSVWGHVQSVIATAWDLIKGTIGNALLFIKGIIDVFIAIFTGDWGKAWDGIKTAFGAIWDQIKLILGTALDLIKQLVGLAWDAVKLTIGTALSAIWDLVVGKFGEITTWLSGLPGRFAAAVVALWDWIWQRAGAILVNVITWFTDVGDWIAALPTWFADKVVALWDWIWTRAGDIKDEVIAGFVAFGEWLGGLPSWIAEKAGDVWGWIVTAARNAAAEAWQALQDAFLGSGNASDWADQQRRGVGEAAHGGVFTQGTLTWIGEGREREWALPDSKLAAFADQIIAGTRGGDGGAAPSNLSVRVVLPERVARALDTSAAAGQLTRDGLSEHTPVSVGSW